LEEHLQPLLAEDSLGVELLLNLKDKDCLEEHRHLPLVADFLEDKLKHNHKLLHQIYLVEVQVQLLLQVELLTFSHS
jgi:hypothetical protein